MEFKQIYMVTNCETNVSRLAPKADLIPWVINETIDCPCMKKHPVSRIEWLLENIESPSFYKVLDNDNVKWRIKRVQ